MAAAGGATGVDVRSFSQLVAALAYVLHASLTTRPTAARPSLPRINTFSNLSKGRWLWRRAYYRVQKMRHLPFYSLSSSWGLGVEPWDLPRGSQQRSAKAAEAHDSTISHLESVALLRTVTQFFHTTLAPYYHRRVTQRLCRDLGSVRQQRPAGVLAVLSLQGKQQDLTSCCAPQGGCVAVVPLGVVVRGACALAEPTTAARRASGRR